MIVIDKDMPENVYINCGICKHILKDYQTCKAFPKGIPDEILTGENDHLKPLPDQENGIVFEAID